MSSSAVGKVSQDYLLRTALKERDCPGGSNIGLLDLVACALRLLADGAAVIPCGLQRAGCV
jgi:hypothetical protein